ncbi:MAG: N-acetylglucosamine-6-phosphate deacetylase [Clostridia bacterium]|nr:N-acetylglucosamine-6-phosphate deacetylase [Clostridia bacterium]
MKTIIHNARLLGGDAVTVFVTDGVITAMGKGDLHEGYTADQIIDAEGNYLVPGLIDIHSHGCIGRDTMDGDGLGEMADEYLRHGVTTWYPTTMTESPERIRAAMDQPLDLGHGAHMPGFHVEGPYINQKYKGAQNEAFIKKPDLDEFLSYENAAMVTVAPELAGSEAFIRRASKQAVVSIGHTDCDYDTAYAAFMAGANCLTHTCNAMPPLLHRAPWPIRAALTAGGYAQVISDGLHLHPAMVLALYRIFGRERMILISDSMRATGLSDGVYDLGSQPITVKNGEARTEGGALAGSTTTLFTCVQRAIKFGIPAADAFAMASETPATLMGLRKGRVEIGYDADLLLVDEQYNLLRSMIL